LRIDTQFGSDEVFFKGLIALIALAAVIAGGWFGRVVPFAEQWPVFEALRTTASIIFAVIGAWLAIIYPDRLKLSFRSEAEHTESATGIGQLFTPVVHSTLILCVILVIGAVAPIAKRIDVPHIDVPIEVMRGGCYGLLVALTLWQLWTVVLTLVPADRVKSFVDGEDRRATAVAGYKGKRPAKL